jgi:predicted transcriptional regulator YdeE
MIAFIESKRPGVIHYVRDCKQAAEWYRDMLGFEIGPHEYNSFVEMNMDGKYMFHLTPAQEGMIPHSAPIIQFSSRDIERTYSTLKSKGIEVGSMSWYPDYSSFTICDIDGNAIAISQHFDMRVKELGEMLLVGIHVVCVNESEYVVAIPRAAFELKQRITEIPNTLNSHLMVGAYKADNDPDGGYWVCVQVERFGDIPNGMGVVEISPQRYAVKWHYGHRSEVSRAYHELHELIHDAGHQRKPMVWSLEMLRNWGHSEESEIELDLYCPII